MGDEFTPEELVILGEAPEPKPEDQEPPAGGEPPTEEPPKEEPPKEEPPKEPEHTAEEKAAAEKMGLRVEGGFIIDDDGTKIPAKRWKSLYRDYKDTQRGATETTRKLNLFKELGADKFYELYPEEKPAGYKPPAREERAAPAIPANMGNMMVQGGPHNGKTLNEVWQEDPAAAALLQTQYLESQRETRTKAEQSQEALKKEAETEVATFSDNLATDMFGKKAAELSAEESRQVTDTIQATLEWMAKTNRTQFIQDAYFLMNRENILKATHEKGAKAALASLQKPAIPSVDTGGGKSVTTTDHAAMSTDDLAREMAGWSEAKYVKYLKDAPAAVKAKHPSLPWD